MALKIVVLASFFTGPSVVTASADDFIAGADMSHLAYFESIGIVYRTNGVARDALTTLKNRGLNCVRLRLFTSSAAQAAADPYNYINNTNYTIPLAVRVKNAGLKLLLDFHFSDTWADPGDQLKPAAWTNLNFTQLKAQMRACTSNSIAAFKAAGAMPDYVQIGNEITGGLLWNDGRVGGSYETSTQWSQLAQLMTNAIQGVKDAAGTNQPKIIIHIDRGGDWGSTQWFFDNLTSRNVQFDIIGESYYPFSHGSLSNLNNCLTNAAKRYGKPVAVMETDFPWNNSTNIFGIPASTNGQVQYVATLAQIVKGVPGGLGAGIVWWGTEYQPVSGANQAGFGNRSFFNGSGNVLPVAGAFGQLVAPIQLSAGLSNGNFKISWPLSGAGMSLTYTSNLTASAPWQTVTNMIQSTGTIFNVTLPLSTNQNRFYHLKSQ